MINYCHAPKGYPRCGRHSNTIDSPQANPLPHRIHSINIYNISGRLNMNKGGQSQ